MIPNTTGAVLAFFLFVAPGLLFDLLSERRRAGIPETSFREASRVVLASTAFTTLALGLVAAPCLVVPQARRWIFEWLMGSAALNATQPLVLLMMFVVAAMACALAGAAHWRLSRSGIRLRHVHWFLGAMVFGACWLLSELARAEWFTGFPWGASGYAHIDGPLAAYARWVGMG